MDPITHLIATRKLISSDRKVMVAGLAADAPFYLTYPLWLIGRGEMGAALKENEWPGANISRMVQAQAARGRFAGGSSGHRLAGHLSQVLALGQVRGRRCVCRYFLSGPELDLD
jgi:hypothetical protein